MVSIRSREANGGDDPFADWPVEFLGEDATVLLPFIIDHYTFFNNLTTPMDFLLGRGKIRSDRITNVTLHAASFAKHQPSPPPFATFAYTLRDHVS